MVLNQNPISSMYLKMRLARRYTSPAFLSETQPFLRASPDGVINDNETVEVQRVVFREGGSLDDGMCRLRIYNKLTRKMAVN